jgi:hypothetical protein
MGVDCCKSLRCVTLPRFGVVHILQIIRRWQVAACPLVRLPLPTASPETIPARARARSKYHNTHLYRSGIIDGL